MLRGMKVARTIPSAPISGKPGKSMATRRRKLLVIAPPVSAAPAQLSDDDDDDEPLLPGDEEWLAMTEEERLAQPTIPHEEILREFADILAKYQPQLLR